MAITTLFDEKYMVSTIGELPNATTWEGRLIRYQIYWSMVAGDTYRDSGHGWAAKVRADYGLYAYIRNLSGIGLELADFWQSHLWGGALDPDTGNGEVVPSALPIHVPTTNTSNETALRKALSQLWQDSNWTENKDEAALLCMVLGDVAIEVIDDPERKKVYLRVVDPGSIAKIDRDMFGNVKGYTRREYRPDPRLSYDPDPKDTDKLVTYTEIVTRKGKDVVYTTYLDREAYDWSGRGTTWSMPYGFVPLVVISPRSVGPSWGWSELRPALRKIMEIDDVSSMLDDHIRRMTNAPMLFNFGKPQPPVAGASGLIIPTSARSIPRSESGREEMRSLYIAQADAKGQPLVTDLDIAASDARIDKITIAIERMYPEIQFERLRRTGNVPSGVALRIVRQPTETKVKQRRAGPDDALVRVQQMAVAIGGMRGYTGFEGFGLDSYASGALDHRIGDRPVFGVDALERLEEDEKFWTVADMAVRAGLPLAVYLEEAGWDQVKIARTMAAIELQQVAAADAFNRTLNQT